MLAGFAIEYRTNVNPMRCTHLFLNLSNECQFQWMLVLDDCDELQEIKGIPPCIRMLPKQVLQEARKTWFCLPRAKIPEWFNHQSSVGLSISFWFHNKFPAIALCVVSPSTFPAIALCAVSPLTLDDFRRRCVRVIINGNTFFYQHGSKIVEPCKVDFGFPFMNSGIHVLNEKSSMKDTRFTIPENDANIVFTLDVEVYHFI
ncbi:hypothetical protein TSUD_296560 [Trifolium subterraneum]|uniref:C-JID domain-containing protein n=1 Tax=Trifolium subterraneum TaxID=3900 RepID=A0A2Z6LUK6_TRISU|nr:hypothetical protein TSUD_296560 [Trifolium subterraneum]